MVPSGPAVLLACACDQLVPGLTDAGLLHTCNPAVYILHSNTPLYIRAVVNIGLELLVRNVPLARQGPGHNAGQSVLFPQILLVSYLDFT